MKGHCLVIDNVCIRSSADVGKYFHIRGYLYVYFPLYSPKLKPIEQF